MSKFDEHWKKVKPSLDQSPFGYHFTVLSWNAAIKTVLNKIKYKNKLFEGDWQHEDIDHLIQEIAKMKQK